MDIEVFGVNGVVSLFDTQDVTDINNRDGER